jgi:hypothetical protein
MHLVLKPLALVNLEVWPVVTAVATDIVVCKLSLVVATLREHKVASAMLTTSVVLALILGSVGPLFLAKAMLFIMSPVTCVNSAIGVMVGSFSMSLILEPLSFIYITICMVKFSITCGSTQARVALVA